MATIYPLSPVAILRAYDRAIALPRSHFAALSDFGLALRIGQEIHALRLARGEKQVGYKIGFTNRGIWPLYGVDRPIWAPVYDTTFMQLPGRVAQLGLGRFVLPRLEPETVIGMASTPKNDSIEGITDAIAWVAHGFEVVQSHLPDWKFSAAEAQACQALHGCLLVGERASPSQFSGELAGDLSSAKLVLAKQTDGEFKVMAHGQGANVLDGPVQALAFLMQGLAEQGETLKAGQIITTGTLTDALPIESGQVWRTEWIAGAKDRPTETKSNEARKKARANAGAKTALDEPKIARRFALAGLELTLT